ncbi:hypothetical protein QC764_310455 [Podospora pseudoanserina]|uniref:Ecp2 effector protein-like domain-containing protein n=1 Tax=Podospora pseudoanserina TaxID=2609844 RepID=A0ABR0IF15_9PEZI|nr:hypothetical protein QC764_310455 [Podospora pseudoanserina]
MQFPSNVLAFGSLFVTAGYAHDTDTSTSAVDTTLITSVSIGLSTTGTTLSSATDTYSGTVTDALGDSTGLIKPRPTTEGGGPLDTVYACGDTTVIDQFSYGSPLVKDCWDVYNGLDGKTDPWILDHMWEQRAFASSGTCVIGAQIVSQTDYPSYVGSEDFRIAIKKSIEQFAKKDDKSQELVGTKGYMQCGTFFFCYSLACQSMVS